MDDCKLSEKKKFSLSRVSKVDLEQRFRVGSADGVKIRKLGERFKSLYVTKRINRGSANPSLVIYNTEMGYVDSNMIDVLGEQNAMSIFHLWFLLRAISENGCRKELEILANHSHANIFLVKDRDGKAGLVYGFLCKGEWIITCPPHVDKSNWILGNKVVILDNKPILNSS